MRVRNVMSADVNAYEKVRRFLDLEAEVYEDEDDEDDEDDEGQRFNVSSM